MSTEKKTRTRRAPEHYVNNREFSEAVMSYALEAHAAVEVGNEPPKITEYIGDCFLRISEGLSHKPNWIGYSYRDEMVMDGVIDCLRAITNYDITKATRTGKPNAFGYFTRICWNAFLRRIAKEKKQKKIRDKLIAAHGIDEFLESSDNVSDAVKGTTRKVVDDIRTKVENLASITRQPQTFDMTPRHRKLATDNIIQFI